MTFTVVTLVAALVLGLFAAPVIAEAQQAEKVYRIGAFADRVKFKHLWDPFQQRLRELGYVEGQNLAIEWRLGAGPERRRAVIAEFVRLKVDVIVAAETQTATAAKQGTSTIPIVILSGDPVGNGLVSNLARPGGNVTGVSTQSADLIGKQLELLKEIIPRVSRVAILWNPDNPLHTTTMPDAEAAARKLRLQPQPVAVRGRDDWDRAFLAMRQARTQAFLALADSGFGGNRAIIADLAAKTGLPAVYHRRDFVEAGGLIAYGADLIELNRRLAVYVDRILKGANPGDLPVEQPSKFELVINLRAAKALGLTIPQSLLLRADQLIE